MKKKILAVIMLISIISYTSVVLANDNTNNNQETTNIIQSENYTITSDLDYKDPNFNWDEISYIQVVYIGENDDFIKTAKEHGVKVDFLPMSLGYMAQPRLTHFSSISWITRNNVISLSLNPIHPFTINKSDGWAEAVRFFQYHPIYTSIPNPSKYNSLLNQFDCHVDFAKGFKTPWNLEPNTPDKGYRGFVGSKCN